MIVLKYSSYLYWKTNYGAIIRLNSKSSFEFEKCFKLDYANRNNWSNFLNAEEAYQFNLVDKRVELGDILNESTKMAMEINNLKSI